MRTLDLILQLGKGLVKLLDRLQKFIFIQILYLFLHMCSCSGQMFDTEPPHCSSSRLLADAQTLVKSLVGYVSSAQIQSDDTQHEKKHIARDAHLHVSTETHTHTHAHSSCQHPHTSLPKGKKKKTQGWGKWHDLKNSFYLFSARRGCHWIAVRGLPLSGSTRLSVCVCMYIAITPCVWSRISMLNGQHKDHCRVCARALECA